MAGLIGGLSVDQQTELIYVGYFNRSADAGGFVFWEGQNASAQAAGQGAATALTNIANSFTPQPETIALYPFLGVSHPDLHDPVVQAALSSFINNVYGNLFGHTADSGGLSYWLGQITSGAVGLGAAVLAIANGATGTDATIMLNKVTVGLDFTTRTAAAGQGFGTPDQALLDAAHNVLTGVDGTSLNDASVTAGEAATTQFINSGAGLPGSTFTLTTAVDALTGTGGSDTFIGVITGGVGTTLNPGDNLSGGSGGVDTVQVVDSFDDGGPAANQLAGVTLTHIGKFVDQNISTTGTKANTFDFSAAPSVKDVVSNNSFAGTNTVFQNLSTGAQVFATGGATGLGTSVFFNMKTASDAVTEGVRGGVNGATVETGLIASTNTAATIKSDSGAANGATVADTFLVSTGGTVTSLAILADANLTAAVGGLAAKFALTVSGAATAVSLTPALDPKTVDATGLTVGGLKMTTAADLTSFKGGGGNNALTLGATPAAAVTITMQGGNDSVFGTGGVLATGSSIDGGAGTDTISAALVNAGDGAAIKNFELLDLGGFGGKALDAALLTASTISGVTIDGNGAIGGTATVLDLTANATVTDTFDSGATHGSMVLTHTGGSGTLAISFAETSKTTTNVETISAITSTGDTSVSIASGGASTGVGFGNTLGVLIETDHHLATVSITGAQAFTLGEVFTDDAAGPGIVASSLTKIDGSAATGNLTIIAGFDSTASGGATVTYTGLTINDGSGTDTVFNGALNGVVNMGSGKDTVEIFFPNVSGTIHGDTPTVNGGANTDTLIDFVNYNRIATAVSAQTDGNLVAFTNTHTGDLVFGAAVGPATLGAAVSVAGASTFDQAVFLAHTGGAGNVTWFQFAGNTFLDESGGTVNSSADIIVKLTGLVSETTATVSGGFVHLA